MIKYLIIDDEYIAHDIVKGYCDLLPNMQLMKNCYDALEAFEYLNKKNVDLMFLDLNMPKLKGFEFLKTLKNPPKVIVTTAYREYAIEGYELNISDYLLKPFSFERFIKAINKTIDTTENKKSAHILTNTEAELNPISFFLKGDKKHHQIHFEDLLFIEAYGHYTKVYLKNDMIVSNQKISDFDNLLPKSNFIRIHKSFIVAKNKIKHIEGNRIIINEHKIPIGQTYKGNINKLL